MDSEARILESQIPNKIGFYSWKTSHILGPSPSAFSSIEAWRNFKQKVNNLSVNDSKWIVNSIECNESQVWICLFFHPDHWSLLVEKKLIAENERNNFLNTPLGSILSISRLPLDIFQSVSFLSNKNLHKVSVYAVLQVALKIVREEGIERVTQTWILDAVLHSSSIQEVISTEELKGLLHQAIDLPSLPSVWVDTILRLCMNTPNPDIELLLDLLEKNKHLKPRFIFIHENRFPTEWNQILKRLLDSSRSSALDLGIAMLARVTPDREMQDALIVRLLAESSRYANSDNESFGLFLYALLKLDPSLEEFSLWAKPEVIQLMHRSPTMLDNLSKRFGSAVDPEFKLDHQQLRKQFSIFVANRHDYPATVSLGALEAILKIDEANLPALDSKIWQQTFDE